MGIIISILHERKNRLRNTCPRVTKKKPASEFEPSRPYDVFLHSMLPPGGGEGEVRRNRFAGGVQNPLIFAEVHFVPSLVFGSKNTVIYKTQLEGRTETWEATR